MKILIPRDLILFLITFALATQKRIKGGEVVTPRSPLSFPHHVQLVMYRDDAIHVFCGGTLLGEKYVYLTMIGDRTWRESVLLNKSSQNKLIHV